MRTLPWRRLVRRRPRIRFSFRDWARRLAVFLAWFVTLSTISLSAFFLHARSNLPEPEAIISRQVKESTKIYDSTGEVLLYDIYDEERRTVVEWGDIAQDLKDATVAVEDDAFYEHRGFDIRGFLRSVVRNLQRGYGEGGGGSTITQQLIGNALVGRQVTLQRKVQELVLALEVERRFTKDEILWMYVNQIPYGSNAYGVEAASQTYFGIPASELSLAQSALLASLPQRPSYLSPYGLHLDELFERKDFILKRMLELGYITQDEYDEALAEELEFKPPTKELAAPHFVIMARTYAIEKYGEALVESGGFRIITTLDAELQREAEEIVTEYAALNRDRFSATNAALVSIDPRTGQVRALVGSANYFDIENEGNFNVATAQRQPGSSFKPFAYAALLQQGYPDSTILWDVRTEFNPGCAPNSLQTRAGNGSACYHPRNYNGQYFGPVTLRQSLARSLNTTSVKTLYLAGVDNVIDLAERMGITTLQDRSRFGLSLVLGGAEVRLVDITSAYGVFANDGIRNPWALIERIELADGTVLEERTDQATRVLDAQTSRLVNDMLSDNPARAAVFGFNSPLYFAGRPVAAKTGTTQDNRDAWIVGYTPSLVTGVWVGNNDNAPMTDRSAGSATAGPLWRAFMLRALSGISVEAFPKPGPVFSSKPMLDGTYSSPSSGGAHSVLHFVDRTDPLGPAPLNPAADPLYTNWEWAVRSRLSI